MTEAESTGSGVIRKGGSEPTVFFAWTARSPERQEERSTQSVDGRPNASPSARTVSNSTTLI